MRAAENADERATRAGHLLVIAAFLTAAGVLVAGTVARAVGGVLVLAGWSLGIFGLHAFGRSGRARAAAPKAAPPIDPSAESDEGPAGPAAKSADTRVDE